MLMVNEQLGLVGLPEVRYLVSSRRAKLKETKLFPFQLLEFWKHSHPWRNPTWRKELLHLFL